MDWANKMVHWAKLLAVKPEDMYLESYDPYGKSRERINYFKLFSDNLNSRQQELTGIHTINSLELRESTMVKTNPPPLF